VPAQAYFVPATALAATMELGQSNFTGSAPATTDTGMSGPTSVALDPLTRKVFVADSQNNRVLRFATLYALSNGMPAEAVLGQQNFTTGTPATTRSGMRNPQGVFVDTAGRLWVADTDNSRVLRFDNASLLASGANANAVLGQPNFTSSLLVTTRKTMEEPETVFVDAAGRLWVADTSDCRVLRFDAAAAKANGANADAVLGQPDFTSSNDQLTTQASMIFPYGLTVDGSGRLWVADTGNNRVLRFDNAAARPNGAKANAVLGQPNFTNIGGGTTQNTMWAPFNVALDPGGHLYVAEGSGNRILGFNAAAGLPNGGNASFVLGQPDFTSHTANNGGISASTLNYAHAVFYDPPTRVLWVADAANNRVLMYGNPSIFSSPHSAAAGDGWVLESAEHSSVGGTKNPAGLLRLGDDAANKQYRSLLSFNTQALPDYAIIRSVTLKIKKAGVVGADPLLTFGPLLADIKQGAFGLGALQPGDFQAAASASAVAHFIPAGAGWYQFSLPAADYPFINLTGLTQFRLRFTKDDNNNHLANYDTFFAGDALATDRPLLIIEYTLP